MALKINNQHRLFVENYLGNTVEAMRAAGFQGTDKQLEYLGNQLLANPTILDAIKQRDLYRESTAKAVATRTERQAFWTSIMRNEDPHYIPEVNDKGVTKPKDNLPLPMRLKASELLGKSETDFVEKIDMNHNLTITDVIKEAYTISIDNLDAIEAQYELLHNHKKEQSEMVDVEDVSDSNDGSDTDGFILGDYI